MEEKTTTKKLINCGALLFRAQSRSKHINLDNDEKSREEKYYQIMSTMNQRQIKLNIPFSSRGYVTKLQGLENF